MEGGRHVKEPLRCKKKLDEPLYTMMLWGNGSMEKELVEALVLLLLVASSSSSSRETMNRTIGGKQCSGKQRILQGSVAEVLHLFYLLLLVWRRGKEEGFSNSRRCAAGEGGLRSIEEREEGRG